MAGHHQQGIEEIGNARVHDKVGFAISRIEILAFELARPGKTQGLIPVNVSFIPERPSKGGGPDEARLRAGPPRERTGACADEGERIGELTVRRCTGFATVCSIVVNGILLKSGIPMDPDSAASCRSRTPTAAFVGGDSTTRLVDRPSEVFIRGG